MGNTEFYEALMPARELVTGVRPASELDEWTTVAIEERMQRDLNLKRVMDEIAPYLAQSQDRFFSSVIVLVYRGEIHFESLSTFEARVPRAYESAARDIGFITIDGGALIVLDGQHRLLALEKVVKNEVTGPYAQDVASDSIGVIFIKHETNEKTRRIFNKVNRYAKPTSRGDNIITSEDDGYAIIARRLLDEAAPLGVKDDRGDVIVNWRSNTLSRDTNKLSTISAVYESVKLILTSEGVEKLDERKRPTDEQIEEYYGFAEHFWAAMLEGLRAYQQALSHPKQIHEMRRQDQPYSLLFKPAAQLALVGGLVLARRYGLNLSEATQRANAIDWQMSSPLWRDIIVRRGGGIDANAEARDLAARLIGYLIAGEKISPGEVERLREAYNSARGEDLREPLPPPVAARPE